MFEFNWMTIKFGSAKQKGILHVIRVRKLDHQQMWQYTRKAFLVLVSARRFLDIPSPQKSARIQCISFAMAFSPRGEFFNPGDQSRFENMMKLLLFLEAELQLKEEIIDLLLVCIVQFW